MSWSWFVCSLLANFQLICSIQLCKLILLEIYNSTRQIQSWKSSTITIKRTYHTYPSTLQQTQHMKPTTSICMYTSRSELQPTQIPIKVYASDETPTSDTLRHTLCRPQMEGKSSLMQREIINTNKTILHRDVTRRLHTGASLARSVALIIWRERIGACICEPRRAPRCTWVREGARDVCVRAWACIVHCSPAAAENITGVHLHNEFSPPAASCKYWRAAPSAIVAATVAAAALPV